MKLVLLGSDLGSCTDKNAQRITSGQNVAPNDVTGTNWQCAYTDYFGFILYGGMKEMGTHSPPTCCVN